MSADEFNRQCRVVDQMLTAHCVLRDSYERRAMVQDVLTLLCSVTFAATTFIDPAVLEAVGTEPERARLVRGFAAIGVFASSVVGLRVRWKERGGGHRVAAGALSDLKAGGRSIDPVLAPDKAEAWLQEARRLLKGLPEIPDRLFLRLKARHLRKVEVSKLISRRPGAWVFWLRVVVWWRGTFGTRSTGPQT